MATAYILVVETPSHGPRRQFQARRTARRPTPGERSFVSIEQAREIALSAARENRGFYGDRYQGKEMDWEVTFQDEREDGYCVRLNFRLSQGFRGQPGVEEIIVQRTGSVRSRRIVVPPLRGGGMPGCGLVSTGAIVVAALAVAGMAGVGF